MFPLGGIIVMDAFLRPGVTSLVCISAERATMSNHRAVLHSLYSGFGVFCFALLGGASSAGAVDVDPISFNIDNPFAILEVFDDKARLGGLTPL